MGNSAFGLQNEKTIDIGVMSPGRIFFSCYSKGSHCVMKH